MLLHLYMQYKNLHNYNLALQSQTTLLPIDFHSLFALLNVLLNLTL